MSGGNLSGWYTGRAYVPTKVLYLVYGGRLWGCVCMCYIVYEGWILDGYIMDT